MGTEVGASGRSQGRTGRKTRLHKTLAGMWAFIQQARGRLAKDLSRGLMRDGLHLRRTTSYRGVKAKAGGPLRRRLL